MKGHSQPRDLIGTSAIGQPILRMDNVLITRGNRGTWLIGLKIPSAHGYRYLQIPIGKHRALDALARELLTEASEGAEPVLAVRSGILGSPPAAVR